MMKFMINNRTDAWKTDVNLIRQVTGISPKTTSWLIADATSTVLIFSTTWLIRHNFINILSVVEAVVDTGKEFQIYGPWYSIVNIYLCRSGVMYSCWLFSWNKRKERNNNTRKIYIFPRVTRPRYLDKYKNYQLCYETEIRSQKIMTRHYVACSLKGVT